ncbi:MFS transporter [Ancylobacter pratisalsi]|uniref:MFS transporter n=1 Tax=Ancylobacter pratisalsi TaxID=1745854 RepID=A0A6P1YR32_9HYPH|nr:MFS transporter [Ancylobacter pratisalsi]QIB35849.1 MFS transporter [Ancylobacter pratisalsi]
MDAATARINEAGDASRASLRDWAALAVLALPCMVYAMDLTVLNLAVPHLALDLKPSPAQLLWIIDIYGFMVAGTLMLMGTLGDRIGRRRLLLIGAAAFGAASILAAFARSAEELIATRALLGIAGATLAPSTLSMVRNIFRNERERTFAIGIWIACFSSGAALGPLVGGVILSFFWWGAVFLAAVPVMIGLLLIGPILLPEFRDAKAGRLDIISALQCLAASLSVIYAMKHIAESGLDLTALAVLAFGLVVGAFFIARQKRLDDPMIDLELFRHPGIGAALALNVTALFGAMGIFIFISQYLQLVLGMSAMETGLWTAPSGLCFALGSLATPYLVRRFRVVDVLSLTLALAVLGFLLLTQVTPQSSMMVMLAAIVLFSFGLAPVGTLSTDLMMRVAPPERAGAASGISEASFEFGGALGIAVLGSLVAASYRLTMAEADLSGLSAEAADRARLSLDGAVTAAASLSPETAARLLGLAHQAYSIAFDRAALACVVTTLIGMVIVRLRLGRV